MARDMAQPTEPPETPGVPRNTFAARLVLIRHELKLTVDEISARCGVASATWSTWEHGTKPRDMADVCMKVSDATGYNRDWLAFGTPIFLVVSNPHDVVRQDPLPGFDSFAPALELVKVGE